MRLAYQACAGAQQEAVWTDVKQGDAICFASKNKRL